MPLSSTRSSTVRPSRMASACRRRASRAATAGSCSSASVSANSDRAPSGVRNSWLMLARKSRRTSSSRRRSVTSSTATSTSPEPSPSGWAASSKVSRGGPARSTRRVTVRPPSIRPPGHSPLGRSPPADPVRPIPLRRRRTPAGPGLHRQSAGSRLHQGIAVAGLQVALSGRVGRPQLVVGFEQQQRLGQPVEHGAQAPGPGSRRFPGPLDSPEPPAPPAGPVVGPGRRRSPRRPPSPRPGPGRPGTRRPQGHCGHAQRGAHRSAVVAPGIVDELRSQRPNPVRPRMGRQADPSVMNETRSPMFTA